MSVRLSVAVVASGLAAIFTGSGSGCGSGSALPPGDVDADLDGATSEGSTADGAPPDGASSDGAATDGSVECKLLGGTYDKTCGTAADCTTVARGCYCGKQPVIGVAKSVAAAAGECEQRAASDCALGCASFPGQQAEDGKSPDDGGVIVVECTASKCTTVVP